MMVPLSNVAEINPKNESKVHLSNDEMLDFLPMAAVLETGSISVSTQRPLSEVQKGFTSFRKGDVLVAKITPCFENNKIAIADITTEVGFGSTEFHVVRCDQSRLYNRYLLHLLRSSEVRAEGKRRMTGSAGQQRVPKNFLADLNIHLPPLEEQKRIAAILDQADELRRKRQRALDRLNQLGQAIFIEMFGDLRKSTFEREPLVALTSKIGSGATPKGGDCAYKVEGIPLIRSMNVRNGHFSEDGLVFIDEEQASKLDNVTVKGGDVLLNITGASVARVCSAPVAMDGARVNQHVSIIRPTERLLSVFVEAYLLLPIVKKTLLNIAESGATRQAITKVQIEQLTIPVPAIRKQEEFALRIGIIKQLHDRVSKHCAYLESLFTSLQHRAFRGELTTSSLKEAAA